MPQQIICRKCGEVLYNGLELLPPEDVIRKYDEKCPKCGSKLRFKSEDVEIKIYKKLLH